MNNKSFRNYSDKIHSAIQRGSVSNKLEEGLFKYLYEINSRSIKILLDSGADVSLVNWRVLRENIKIEEGKCDPVCITAKKL